MYTQTQTKTILDINFNHLNPYKTQLNAVLKDSEFAQIPKELQDSVVRIFEQKINVLIKDVEMIVEEGVENLDEEKISKILDRLSFAQKYFFEDGFQKSIETYIDMYLISDAEDEIYAYRKLEMFFAQLIRQIRMYLEEINYAQYIGKLNSLL